MKNIAQLTVIIALAAGTHAASAGDVTGTITLKGTPPAEKEITALKDDPNCGKLHTEAVKTRFYVVGGKGELGDVFVTLKGLSGKSSGATASALTIDQKGCEYLPYVATAQTGQKILVKNSDPVLHNVHTQPAVAGNKESNQAQMAGAGDITMQFDNPEPFLKFKCDVHPWMFAYVCVTDHPYAAVTGKDGTFALKNVPPGKYTLEATHRKAGTVTKEIEVTADGAKAELTLEAK